MRGSLSILACMGCLLHPARVLMYGVVPIELFCHRFLHALREAKLISAAKLAWTPLT
jgi:hypothetical protein